MILSLIRTLLLYLVLIAMIRLMGKRQVGQMGPAEFVVTMLAANLASIPMEDTDVPLAAGLVPLLTVLGAELTISLLTLKWLPFRRLLEGQPVVLIENGKLLQSSLKKTRLTLEELMEHLRLKDVLEISQVQYAILETGGELSVFPFPADRPATARDAGIQASRQDLPVVLISDGRLLSSGLSKAGVDRQWVRKLLADRNLPQNQVLLLTLDRKRTVTLIPKEDRP